MLNLRAEIRQAVTEAVAAAQAAKALPAGTIPEVAVEYPPFREDGTLGHYASPVALVLGKRWGKAPAEVAEIIRQNLPARPMVQAATVAPPGFVNFALDPAWLSAKLDDVIASGEEFARTDVGKGTSVNLEFLSANPTGLPHVGNGRSLFAADVLGNVLAAAGFAVTREYYVNDVGAQVEKYGESVLRRMVQRAGYTVEYPEELYQGEDAQAVAADVAEELLEDRGHRATPDDLSNADLRAEVTRRAVEATLSAIRKFVEGRAGVRYDVWFRESTLHERGDVADVLRELKKRGVAVEREGATWLLSTKYGDDKDRVLVRANGEPTYLASDIAYHRDKLRRGFVRLVDFWGADHQGHLLPLRAGLRALGEDADALTVQLVHLVRVVSAGEAKKISKRLGTAMPLSELLDTVGLSAARFFLTLKPLTSPFDLDLDLARAQKEENPVYYVQYAYVRLTSVLRKAKQQKLVDGSLLPPAAGRVPLTDPQEVALVAYALRLPEVLEDIVRTAGVQRLPQFALELARAVHHFYETVPVLQASERDVLLTRLALVTAVRSVLGTTFDLLAVEKREVM